jgi:hypothetical protein
MYVERGAPHRLQSVAVRKPHTGCRRAPAPRRWASADARPHPEWPLRSFCLPSCNARGLSRFIAGFPAPLNRPTVPASYARSTAAWARCASRGSAADPAGHRPAVVPGCGLPGASAAGAGRGCPRCAGARVRARVAPLTAFLTGPCGRIAATPESLRAYFLRPASNSPVSCSTFA